MVKEVVNVVLNKQYGMENWSAVAYKCELNESSARMLCCFSMRAVRSFLPVI
ncbi:hypothetical protein Y597_6045 [Burkholderia pseudomallei MSHR1000]|nr:hypothetical protein Y597_6045 [Burkholderia pseudomallei MSHR1000]